MELEDLGTTKVEQEKEACLKEETDPTFFCLPTESGYPLLRQQEQEEHCLQCPEEHVIPLVIAFLLRTQWSEPLIKEETLEGTLGTVELWRSVQEVESVGSDIVDATVFWMHLPQWKQGPKKRSGKDISW